MWYRNLIYFSYSNRHSIIRSYSNPIDTGARPYCYFIDRFLSRDHLCGDNHFTGKNHHHCEQLMVDKITELVFVVFIEYIYSFEIVISRKVKNHDVKVIFTFKDTYI